MLYCCLTAEWRVCCVHALHDFLCCLLWCTFVCRGVGLPLSGMLGMRWGFGLSGLWYGMAVAASMQSIVLFAVIARRVWPACSCMQRIATCVSEATWPKNTADVVPASALWSLAYTFHRLRLASLQLNVGCCACLYEAAWPGAVHLCAPGNWCHARVRPQGGHW
jgi:hypothetical protein